jgi:hypothetical protein
MPVFEACQHEAVIGGPEGAVREGDVMGLWLLSFMERDVAVIVEAETLPRSTARGDEPRMPSIAIR